MASLQPLQGTLDIRQAAHLLRRTSYRYKKESVDALAGMNAADAAASLLQLSPLKMAQPVYDDPATQGTVENLTWILPPGQPLPAEDFVLRRYVMGWWVNEALFDPGIGHRMTLFLHQHLVVSASSFGNTHFFDYLSLLRWGALGNFKKLALKIILDNCMLRYLNNNENTKTSPNENFAREFFELFTIGKGAQAGPGDYTNYTEDDIVQAARVLTGIRSAVARNVIDPETNIPRGTIAITQHDTGNKTFSARFQNTTIAGGTTVAGAFQELTALVEMIFAQPETARNCCRRLYRWFVHRNISPEIEQDIIVPLANTLIANNYEIKPVLQQLLQSEHFFDADDSDNKDEIIGGIIKAPLELVLQSMNFFNLDAQVPNPNTQPNLHYTNFYSQTVLSHMLSLAGMPLFFPSDVAGYPGYYQEPDYNRQWFNSSTIIARYKLPAMLLSGRRLLGAAPNALTVVRLNIAPWVRNSGFFTDPADPYVLVQELLRYMLPEEPDSDRFNYFYQTVFLDNLPPYDWTYEWEAYLATGNETEVKIPLERLVNAIMYAPEYQLM
ncbi:MAG: DUF1800 domain-containing protein [Saprospiraceae bacterium]